MTKLARDSRDDVIQAIRLGDAQVLSVTSTGSVASSAFSDSTSLVRVVATVPVRIAVGLSATASTAADRTLLPANVVEHYTVRPSEVVAALATDASGEVNVTEAGE